MVTISSMRSQPTTMNGKFAAIQGETRLAHVFCDLTGGIAQTTWNTKCSLAARDHKWLPCAGAGSACKTVQ